MIKIRIGLFLFLNLLTLGRLFAQEDNKHNLFFHLENSNILIRGLENRIQISSNLGGDYTVTSKSAAIILKNDNNFTVNPIHVKEDNLILDVVSIKNPKVRNSVKFKIINVPIPTIQIGVIEPGLNLDRTSILNQIALHATLTNFFYEGARCVVKSYTLNYMKNHGGVQRIESIKVEGNSLDNLRSILKTIEPGVKLEFTQINVTTPSENIVINNVVFSLK